MTVSAETRLVIDETARAAAKEAIKEYAKEQKLTLELHEANCPGRRVGKGVVTVLCAMAAAAGTSVVLWVKSAMGGK